MRVNKIAFVVAAVMFAAACSETVSGPMPTPRLSATDNNGAIVIKNDGLCGMPGSDADGNIIFGGIGQVTTEVENGNKVMLKCKGENITNFSGRAQNWDDFGCGIVTPSGGFVLAVESHANVSAKGVGTLTCTYVKP